VTCIKRRHTYTRETLAQEAQTGVRRSQCCAKHNIGGDADSVVLPPAEDIEEDEEPVEVALEEGLLQEVRESNIVYVIRCSAHVLQLAVKGFSSVYDDAFDEAMVIRANNPTLNIPSPNDTRWSSKYSMLRGILNKSDELKLPATQVVTFTHISQLLFEFKVATDRVQADAATLLDSCAAWVRLKYRLVEQRPTGQDRVSVSFAADYDVAIQAVNARMLYLATEPYLLLAYFSNAMGDMVGGVYTRIAIRSAQA
jgi:hypothetical protein